MHEKPFAVVTGLLFAMAASAALSAGAVAYYYRHLPKKPSVIESCRAEIPVQPHDILILGDSIAALPEWHELLGVANVRNRAVSGTRTDWIARIDIPACRAVILSTGINDIQAGVSPDVTRANLAIIAAKLAGRTTIVIPPMAPNLTKFRSVLLPHFRGIHVVAPDEAATILTDMQAVMLDAVFLDVSVMLGHDKRLRDDFTDDGLHPNGRGYIALGRLVADALKNRVGDFAHGFGCHQSPPAPDARLGAL